MEKTIKKVIKKIIVVIDEFNGGADYVLYTKDNVSKKELVEKGKQWLRNYIHEYKWSFSPYYLVVKSEKKAPKNVQRIKID